MILFWRMVFALLAVPVVRPAHSRCQPCSVLERRITPNWSAFVRAARATLASRKIVSPWTVPFFTDASRPSKIYNLFPSGVTPCPCCDCSNYVVLRLSQTPWLELTQILPAAIKTSVIIPRIQITENVSSYQLIWLEWDTTKRNEKNIISLLKNIVLALWPWCALNMRFTDDCFVSPWMMQHI